MTRDPSAQIPAGDFGGSGALGDVAGRLSGAAILGFCIGMMIALVEVALRQVWLRIGYGKGEFEEDPMDWFPFLAASPSHMEWLSEKGFGPTYIVENVDLDPLKRSTGDLVFHYAHYASACSRPKKIFAATSRLGASINSW